MQDRIDEARRYLLAKGANAGGHFVEHCAERVNIGTAVNTLALELLGGIREEFQQRNGKS